MTYYFARKVALQFTIIATLLTIPVLAGASGQLGKISGTKYLGQPLDLRTSYTGSKEELSQLHPSCMRAFLADISAQTSFDTAIQDLQTSVSKVSNTRSEIRIYSQTPLKIPLAKLSLSINCPLSKSSQSWTLFGDHLAAKQTLASQTAYSPLESQTQGTREFSLKGSNLLSQTRIRPREESVASSRNVAVSGNLVPLNVDARTENKILVASAKRAASEDKVFNTQETIEEFAPAASSPREARRDSQIFEDTKPAPNDERRLKMANEQIALADTTHNQDSSQYLSTGLIESRPKSNKPGLEGTTDLVARLKQPASQLPIWIAMAGLLGLLGLTVLFGYRWILGRKRLEHTMQQSVRGSQAPHNREEVDTGSNWAFRTSQNPDVAQDEVPTDNSLVFQSLLEQEEIHGLSEQEGGDQFRAATTLSPEVCELLQMIGGSAIRPWKLNTELQQLVNQYGSELLETDLNNIRMNKCNLAIIELAARKALRDNEVYQPEVDLILECLNIGSITHNSEGQPGQLNDLVSSLLNSKFCEMPQASNCEQFKINLHRLKEQTKGHSLCFEANNWASAVDSLDVSKNQ